MLESIGKKSKILIVLLAKLRKKIRYVHYDMNTKANYKCELYAHPSVLPSHLNQFSLALASHNIPINALCEVCVELCTIHLSFFVIV